MLISLASQVSGQTSPLVQEVFPYTLHTGPLDNPESGFSVVYSDTISIDGNVSWLRISFSEAVLAPGSTIRLTSLQDGAVQHLDEETLRQWRNRSAYLNGHSVLFELIGAPGAMGDSVTIDTVTAGVLPGPVPLSICVSDDRVLSSEAYTARMQPGGCTSSIYTPQSCLVTAGHCMLTNDLIEFNVPPSTSGGVEQHPGPEDQYVIDFDTVDFSNGGEGNDWGHFRVFANSETGQWPYDVQGALVTLATGLPDTFPVDIRIVGYGSDSGVDNMVQQLSLGPVTSIEPDGSGSALTVHHQADTTGGNSGSMIILESTGECIGLHSHGGCETDPKSTDTNAGTPITIPGLQAVLCQAVNFDFPFGVPEFVHPFDETVVTADIVGSVEAIDPETVLLHYTIEGEGEQSQLMIPTGSDRYEGSLPAVRCGGSVTFFLTAETVGGELGIEPLEESGGYAANSASEVTVVFHDNFESDNGWFTDSDPPGVKGLNGGDWVRVEPIMSLFGGVTANPGEDNPAGEGTFGFITGQSAGALPGNNDVDGGFARLVSPEISIPDPDAEISFAYWWFNHTLDTDPFDVEISENGIDWTPVFSLTGADSSNTWETYVFQAGEFVTVPTTIRLRFSTADIPNNSTTEAGVDDVRVRRIVCSDTFGDADGDGDVDLTDFGAFQLCFTGPGGDALPTCVNVFDSDLDGDVDLIDFAAFQIAFTG
jgi:V8-like Glu-specific endopeptidase